MRNKNMDAGCYVMPSRKDRDWDDFADFCGLIVMLFMALVILFTLPACGSSSGWRVSFGVAPVTAIQDNQELKQIKEK
jgi:hypothetical protein